MHKKKQGKIKMAYNSSKKICKCDTNANNKFPLICLKKQTAGGKPTNTITTHLDDYVCHGWRSI